MNTAPDFIMLSLNFIVNFLKNGNLNIYLYNYVASKNIDIKGVEICKQVAIYLEGHIEIEEVSLVDREKERERGGKREREIL